MNKKTENILIYRLGSLGDMIVALPIFHLLRRLYPNANIYLLTNYPVSEKTVRPEELFRNTGLIDGYISYPLYLRKFKDRLMLYRKLRSFSFARLIYLAEPRGFLKIFRDILFFKSCRIRKISGLCLKKDLRQNRYFLETNLYEQETVRLLRCFDPRGSIALDQAINWQLYLGADEINQAKKIISQAENPDQIVTCSVSAKTETSIWPIEKWIEVFKLIKTNGFKATFIFIGSKSEYEVSQTLIKRSGISALNLCGKTTIRISAALIKQSRFFIGQDTGPSHLAQALGVFVFALYSGYGQLGRWFPYGFKNMVVYPQCRSSKCRYQLCDRSKKSCIARLKVLDVYSKLSELLSNLKDPS